MSLRSVQLLFFTTSFTNLNTPSENCTSFEEGISDHHVESIHSITLKENVSRKVESTAKPVLSKWSRECLQLRSCRFQQIPLQKHSLEWHRLIELTRGPHCGAYEEEQPPSICFPKAGRIKHQQDSFPLVVPLASTMKHMDHSRSEGLIETTHYCRSLHSPFPTPQ